MEGAQLANPGAAGRFNHKNRLQEHAQRSAVPLPVYQTVNDGPPHAPQFKSTVIVDGETFESSRTFAQLKEAEQDVARVAFEGISQKIKHEGVPLIRNDTVLCKSILHEYATKMKIEKPTYTTAESKGLFPLFITTVAFNGVTYTGDKGKNKKDAEQIGARAVIDSILGSDKGTIMFQIIKSKSRLYAAIPVGNSSCPVLVGNVALSGHAESHSTHSTLKENEMKSAMANDKLPAIPEAASSGQPTNAAAVNSVSSEPKKPKEEVSELSCLNGNDTSLLSPPQGVSPAGPTVSNDSQTTGNNSGKKRSKKGRRGSCSKKPRTDEQSSV